MENQHHQKKRDKLDQDQQHQSTECISQPPPQPPSSTASPPSSSSSPAHEFSFTISLHHHHHHQQPPSSAAKPPPPSLAVDLSPADEIFFHGHLLPLHLLSHLPHHSSPRSSVNLESFTLPIHENPQIPTSTTTTTNPDPINEKKRPKQKPKSKSFSLFGIPIRRKADFTEEREAEEEREKKRKKLKFDLSHVLKRYMRMVRPLFHRRRESDVQLRRQPYSFSGYLSPRDYYDDDDEEVRRKRWGKFSAPVSMKTSPSNSGPLVGNGVVSTSDSTMEELQAAIQAAIAHCKNSIAMDEKINKC